MQDRTDDVDPNIPTRLSASSSSPPTDILTQQLGNVTGGESSKPGAKRCSRCGEAKEMEEFYRNENRLDGRESWCKTCMSAYDDVRHHNGNPHRVREAGGEVVEIVLRSVVFERDRWTCWICKELVDPACAWPDPMSASVDHVIPISQGGEHSYNNVRLAHLRCNVSRRGEAVAS